MFRQQRPCAVITKNNKKFNHMRLAPYFLVKACSTHLKKMSLSAIESAKKAAAFKAVDNHIHNGDKVGVGSGSTIVYAVERLAEKVKQNSYKIICVPTSFQSKQLLVKYNIPVGDLEQYPALDVCIDGADEVDANLTLIKGGGGCLLQEKIVASCANTLIIIADYTKNSALLGEQYKKGIPIEVVPLAYMPIKQRLEKKYKGDVVLRMATAKAGPIITDNGNFILDWKNFDQNLKWADVNTDIIKIPGVVETGLFVNMAKKAYFGLADGSVKEQE